MPVQNPNVDVSVRPAPAIAGQASGHPAPPPPSPPAVYEAMRAQRRELRSQLESLQETRNEISGNLQDPEIRPVDKAGLEARLVEIDARIITVEKQLAIADMQVATAAAVPGAVVEPRPPQRQGPPEEAYIVGMVFILVVFLPLSIAFARRIWRRGAAIATAIPKELHERMTRLEQGVDAIAVEIERIGEGQRFLTRFFAERGSSHAIGEGGAQPVEIKAGDAAAHHRR